MKVRKGLIAAAGFGTRFLPYTKSIPKEMLPIVDKPVIQYVIEDIVSAGIDQVVIVTGSNKRAIEDFFDNQYELERRLEEWGKEDLIPKLREISSIAKFQYVRQQGPYGNATPVKSAIHAIGDEPFIAYWADDFFVAEPKTRSQQLVEAYQKFNTPILACIKLNNPEDTKKYGVIAGQEIEPEVFKVSGLVEKPGPENAPSNIGFISCLLTPEIYPFLESQEPGLGGEYYLTDAISSMINSGIPVHAIVLDFQEYHDTGNKFTYLQTIMEMGIKHSEVGVKFKQYIKDFAAKL